MWSTVGSFVIRQNNQRIGIAVSEKLMARTVVVGIGLENPNRLIGKVQRRLIESNRFLSHTGNFTKFLP